MRLSSVALSARTLGFSPALVVPTAMLSTSTAAVTRRMRPGAWRVWVRVRSSSKLRTAVRAPGPDTEGAAAGGGSAGLPALGVLLTLPGTPCAAAAAAGEAAPARFPDSDICSLRTIDPCGP